MAGKGDFSVACGRERSATAINDVFPLNHASGFTKWCRDQVVIKALWKSMESTS